VSRASNEQGLGKGRKERMERRESPAEEGQRNFILQNGQRKSYVHVYPDTRAFLAGIVQGKRKGRGEPGTRGIDSKNGESERLGTIGLIMLRCQRSGRRTEDTSTAIGSGGEKGEGKEGFGGWGRKSGGGLKRALGNYLQRYWSRES